MSEVYIVVETCGEAVDATAYATRKKAIEYIEAISQQKKEEWDFDDGTIFEGDNNYETVAQVIESKVY